MMDTITNKMSFVRSVVREMDLSNVAMVIDEFAAKRTPHCVLFQWDAGRFLKIGGVQWNVVAMDAIRIPRPGVIVLGEFGRTILVGPGGLLNEQIPLEGSADDRIVPLRTIRALGAKAYAAGMRRQVYVRESPGVWKPIHGSMLSPLNTRTVKGFEAIDGFDDTEIYAGGWEGELWRYDGSTWRSIVSPTNLIISSICCAPDGKVYVCGQGGLFLRGRDDSWEIVDTEDQREDLWSVVWFKGRVFASGFRQILELTDTGWIVVDAALALTDSFYALSTNGEILWSTGSKAILCFDGQLWTRIA
jgi:hypothetical protein